MATNRLDTLGTRWPLRLGLAAQVLLGREALCVTVGAGGFLGIGRHGVVIPVNQMESQVWRLTNEALAV